MSYLNLSNLGCGSTTKNNSISYKFRWDGNIEYVTKKAYSNALKLYNQSICFAENDSEFLAVGYSNRSAVFLEMKMYEECLSSIELARSVENIPIYLMEKLRTREGKCRARMTTSKRDNEVPTPKLSYPAHEQLPFVSSCVEFRRSKKYGRHLVANRDLNVGDIIAIEKPFCTTISNKLRYERCDICAEGYSGNLIPCETCTAVMFCDTTCRSAAMNGPHKFECHVFGSGDREQMICEMMVPIRTVYTALALFDGDSKALCEFAKRADLNDVGTSVFDIDHTKRLTAAETFAPVYDIVTKNEERYDDYLPAMRQILQASKPGGQYANHLMIIIERFSTRLPISLAMLNKNESFLQEKAFLNDKKYDMGSHGVYPFEHLFNHSCVPNLCVTPHGNQMVLSIVRPVKAGHQLFINYGMSFASDPLKHRRFVHDVFGFRCKCVACKNNYPLMRFLQPCPVGMPQAFEQLIFKKAWTRQEARDYLDAACDYMHQIDEYVRSKDWVLAGFRFCEAMLTLYEKNGNKLESFKV